MEQEDERTEARTLCLMYKQDYHVLEPVSVHYISERLTPPGGSCSTGQSVCLSATRLPAQDSRPPWVSTAVPVDTCAHI